MQPHVLIPVEPEWPFRDADAVRFLLVRMKHIVDQPVDNRGLADRSLSHEDELGFIQWPPTGTYAKVIVEDVARLGRLGFAENYAALLGPQHFRWQVQGLIAVQVKFRQPSEMSHGLRQDGQLVAAEVEPLQPRQLADGLRQGGQLVAAEGEPLQPHQLADGLRQGRQILF